MFKKTFLMLCIIAISFLGCIFPTPGGGSGGNTGGDDPIAVTGVSIQSQSSTNITYVGGELQLQAVIAPINATNKNIPGAFQALQKILPIFPEL